MTKKMHIANKIDFLCDTSIAFLNEYKELSPAGKFQACILTATTVLETLNLNDYIEDLHSKSTDEIITILEEILILRYLQFNRKPHVNTNSHNNSFLDELLAKDNKLLPRLNDSFIRQHIRISIDAFWKELSLYREGFERYNNKTGKLFFPELIYLSLYVHPFFNSVVNDSNKSTVKDMIYGNIYHYCPRIIHDFLTIPLELIEDQIDKINLNGAFRQILSE